jgi:hypothetical protein
MGFMAAALPALLLAGCIENPPLPATGTTVFDGTFPSGLEPKAFGDSRLNALSIDSYETLAGVASIRIDVPASSATPGFAGGPVIAAAPKDLSGSTALAFWAKASRPAVLDKVGFGLNFDAPSDHEVTLFGLPLTETWTHHVIPIPDPAVLTAETGLFWYADSDPVTYRFWLADISFVTVDPGLLDLRASLGATALTMASGKKASVPLALTWADLDGARRLLDFNAPGAGPAPSYFTFSSSDYGVASVDASGVVTGVAPGQALVSVRLAGRALAQDLSVTVVASIPAAPLAGPPAPTHPAGDVKSLFSDSYLPAITGITFGTSWSNSVNGVECPAPQWPNCGNRTDLSLAGNNVQRYTGVKFVGVDFASVSKLIDASAMNYFHVDVWTPDATKFGVQLVGFPSAGAGGVGSGVSRTVGFNGTATYGGLVPPISQGSWISLDIPLALFGDLPRSKIGQILWLDNGAISPGGDEGGTFFIDNVYFHK